MPLQTEISAFLQKHGRRLNTDLGQHFLIDDDVLESIVAISDIQPTDHIVEIGAGIGVLTRELVSRAKKVTSIEIDAALIPLLKSFTRDPKNLEIIQGNALQVAMPETPYKIVANIPYHITSPLLRHVFLESMKPPASLTLLMQREVAEKIADKKDAGLLTILVQLFGTPHYVRTVLPAAFLPPPKVDSAVLFIETHAKPIATREQIETIWKLAKIGFSQKRKMLSNTFGNLPGGMGLLSKAEIDPKRRPQTLTIDEWIRLATLFDAAL